MVRLRCSDQGIPAMPAKETRRLFLFVLLVLSSLSFYYVVHYRIATPVAPPRPFDYFKLSLQWPPAVCKGKPRCPGNFTIHGLWPNNYKGRQPHYCDSKEIACFNDGHLFRELTSSWPDLVKHNDQRFWRRQWKKHGTCPLLKQSQYFKLALKLYNKHDVLQHLIDKHITPGAAYPTTLIKETITNLTSKIPDLHCVSNVLHEVRICYKRSKVIKDCPQRSKTCSGNIIDFPG